MDQATIEKLRLAYVSAFVASRVDLEMLRNALGDIANMKITTPNTVYTMQENARAALLGEGGLPSTEKLNELWHQGSESFACFLAERFGVIISTPPGERIATASEPPVIRVRGDISPEQLAALKKLPEVGHLILRDADNTRLEGALSKLGEEHEPPDDWEERHA